MERKKKMWEKMTSFIDLHYFRPHLVTMKVNRLLQLLTFYSILVFFHFIKNTSVHHSTPWIRAYSFREYSLFFLFSLSFFALIIIFFIMLKLRTINFTRACLLVRLFVRSINSNYSNQISSIYVRFEAS